MFFCLRNNHVSLIKQHETKYDIRKVLVAYLIILYEEGQKASSNLNHNRQRLDRIQTGYVQHGGHMVVKCVVQKYKDLFNTELSTAVQTASLVSVYQFFVVRSTASSPALTRNSRD